MLGILLIISAHTDWVMYIRYFRLSQHIQTGLHVSMILGYLHIYSVRLCVSVDDLLTHSILYIRLHPSVIYQAKVKVITLV